MAQQSKYFFSLPFLLILYMVFCSYHAVFPTFNAADEYHDFNLDQGLVTKQPLVFYQKININLASSALLTQIPGIGPRLAERIISHRQKHGPFKELTQLRAINGIGPAKLTIIDKYCLLEIKQ